MNTNNKFQWADSIRVTATVGVILLHLSAPLVSAFGHTDTRTWWTANIYDSALRFCVPVFVMLSGALLLPKEYSIKDFVEKKFVRIVLPFTFWSFLYLIRKIFVMQWQGQHLNFPDTIKWALIQIRDGSTAYHLWYVYMIIGIYLFIPVIGKWIRNASEKEILYFLGLWLLSVIIGQPAISGLAPDFGLSYFSGYLGYLVLGYYLSTKRPKSGQAVRQIAGLLIFISLVITATGTYFLSLSERSYVPYFHGYFSLNVVLFSASVFIYFRNRNYSKCRFSKLINFIGRYSFGIYLAHVMVINHLNVPQLKWAFIPPLIGIPLEAAVCLLISSLIVVLINKLPYGKYISG